MCDHSDFKVSYQLLILQQQQKSKEHYRYNIVLHICIKTSSYYTTIMKS